MVSNVFWRRCQRSQLNSTTSFTERDGGDSFWILGMIVISRISRTGDPTLATTFCFSSIVSSTVSNTNLGSDMEEHFDGISIWLLAILGQTHPNCVGKVCLYIFGVYTVFSLNKRL